MKPPGEQGIPKLPDGLANPADGEKVIKNWHEEQLRQTVSAANLVRREKLAGRGTPRAPLSLCEPAVGRGLLALPARRFGCHRSGSLAKLAPENSHERTKTHSHRWRTGFRSKSL